MYTLECNRIVVCTVQFQYILKVKQATEQCSSALVIFTATIALSTREKKLNNHVS